MDAATSQQAGDEDATSYKHTTNRKLNPSGSTAHATSYTVQDASRSSEPVGGTGKIWFVEEADKLAPSIVALETRRPPTIGPVPKVHHQVSRRRVITGKRVTQSWRCTRSQNSHKLVLRLLRQSAPKTPPRRPHVATATR